MKDERALCIKTCVDEDDMRAYCNGELKPCEVRVYHEGRTYKVLAEYMDTEYFTKTNKIKKDLHITISGACNSGKSRLTYLLKTILKESGFSINFAGSSDFGDNEALFDANMKLNIDSALAFIRDNTNINIKQEQIVDNKNRE